MTISNGKMLNEMDFEKRLKEMPDRDLQEFTARQIFSICKRCEVHGKRITALESLDRRMLIAGGAVGSGTFGVLYGVVQVIKAVLNG